MGKDNDKIYVEMVETMVRVEYQVDGRGNLLVNFDGVIGPSRRQLTEDLMDHLSEPADNSQCDIFKANPEDDRWLSVWDPDWREHLTEPSMFCNLCKYFDKCYLDGESDVTKKIQGSKGTKEEGEDEKTEAGKPFRKLLKKPQD
jgi:hypothetical protein